MTLKGTLKDVSLTNMISVVCNDHGQARLRVISPQGDAQLFLSDGGIVHAEMDSRTGEDVVFEILGWQNGEFELEQDVTAPATSIHTPLGSLLLQGMQRLDERPPAVGESIPTVPADSLESLCATLGGIEGIVGVVAVARDGTVLGSNVRGSDPDVAAKQAEQDGAVAVFVGNAASEIGEVMGLGAVVSVVVDRGADRPRIMVLSGRDYYFGMLLGNTVSPAMVASRVSAVLG